MAKEVNDAHFNQAVMRDDAPVVVLAYAAWCRDSQRILPVFEMLSGAPEYGGVSFVQVEVEDNPEVKKTLGVERYPTLYLFKAGKKIEERIAEVSEDEQEEIIRALCDRAAE